MTPAETLAFGGKYMTNCRDEFPNSWIAEARLSSLRKDPSLNCFGVDAIQPLGVWRPKGWIHPDDPRGWFQWYCRYHQGRRMPARTSDRSPVGKLFAAISLSFAEPASLGTAGAGLEDRSMLYRFYAAALTYGGSDNGAPGLRPNNDANYYGAFVRDRDGHKIEASDLLRKIAANGGAHADPSHAILGAPSTLGLATDGVEHLPDQLLGLGLAERIHARRSERLAVPRRTLRPIPRLAP